VHLAGGFTMGQGVHQSDFAAALDHMLDLNVRTVVNSTGAVVPAMLAQGGWRGRQRGRGICRPGRSAHGSVCRQQVGLGAVDRIVVCGAQGAAGQPCWSNA
jgi:hypothetical protein